MDEELFETKRKKGPDKAGEKKPDRLEENSKEATERVLAPKSSLQRHRRSGATKTERLYKPVEQESEDNALHLYKPPFSLHAETSKVDAEPIPSERGGQKKEKSGRARARKNALARSLSVQLGQEERSMDGQKQKPEEGGAELRQTKGRGE